jgi:hypothetical protein
LLGFVSEVGKDFEDGLSDFLGGVDEQTSEVLDFVGDEVFAGLLVLLHEGTQQVDAGLDVLVGLLLEEVLDRREELLAVQPFSAQAAENISDVASQFSVRLLLQHSK